MMRHKVQISIPTPCHENWDTMSPADKGRFCNSCQKNVIDFTKASDRQITEAFDKDNNLCGRFLKNQLKRDLIISTGKNRFWVTASAAVVALLTIGNSQAFAQTPVNTEQTDAKTANTEPSLSEKRIIKGTVIDNAGIPIPGTRITVKNSKTSVETDFDGVFSLEATTGDILVSEYIGMYTYEVTVTESSEYSITMRDDFNSEFITVGLGHVIYERTFFGRIFNSIGNLFR